MEAKVLGRKVIRYRSELLLSADGSELETGDSVTDCTDGDFREVVLSAAHDEQKVSSSQRRDVLEKFFPLPDTGVWSEAIARLCRQASVRQGA